MKVLQDLTTKPELSKPPKVTLGTFDGVHIGHQSVLGQLVAWAGKTDSPSVAVTFDRRPKDTLRGADTEHITSLKHRLLLIERLGVECALLLRFDKSLAASEPEEFIKRVFVEHLAADGVLLGHDTRFGRNARGDVSLLEKLGGEYGFGVRSIPVVQLDGAPVSSTRVRQAIKAGDLRTAARLLGRPLSALGTVVHGTGRGKSFGYPTANLDLHHELKLPQGVYVAQTGFDRRWHPSVVNIGRPPSFVSDAPPYLPGESVLETHLLDFTGDLYGRDLEIRFLHRLRAERIFDSPEALAKAVARDILAARACLKEAPLAPEPVV